MDTDTKTQKSNVVEMQSAASQLARTEGAVPQAWLAPEWTEERRALARKAVCPPGTTEAEFEFFLAWCKRTGLDPFIKQAFMVERKSKLPNGQWDVKHEPMAAEAGMAARADALPDFLGMRAAAVYAGDEFSIDEETQTVHHKWNLNDRAKAGNRVVGAWAHLKRRGRTVPITYLPIEARIQTRWDNGKQVPTKFWATDPAGQIVKCARAEQYRRGFANIFGGVFISEEYRDEDVVEGEVVPVPAALPASRTESVKEKVKEKVAAMKKPAATPPPPAPQHEVVEGEYAETPPSPAPSPGVAAPAQHAVPRDGMQTERIAPPPSPSVVFGPARGRLVVELSPEELQDSIDLAEGKLAKEPQAKWAPDVRRCLDALKAEQQRRLDEVGGAA